MKEKNILTNPRVVFLLALLCTTLWGSAASGIKTGYRLFEIAPSDTASIVLFAGLRFTLAGILVLLFDRIVNPHREKKPVTARSVIKLASMQTFGQYFLYYIGLAHTTGVSTSIIIGMGTFFSVLMACLIFRTEKLTNRKLIACIIGFLGIVIMNVQTGQVYGSLYGNFIVLLSQICSSMSTVLIHTFTQKEDAIRLSGCQFIVGGLGLMLVGIIMGASIDLMNVQGLFILLYLAMVSAVAYTVWGMLLSQNPVSSIAIYNSLTPFLGVLISGIVLQEGSQAFSIRTLISLALVTVGILVVNMEKKEAK